VRIERVRGREEEKDLLSSHPIPLLPYFLALSDLATGV